MNEEKAEHDYIEYQLDVENGVITGCRLFGEGTQTEPLDGIKIYKPTGQPVNLNFDRWLERVERRLKLAFGRLERTDCTAATYEIAADGKSIKFLPCGVVSHNINDVQNRYCGRCHRFIGG